MNPALEIVELERFRTPEGVCSYLPLETAELEYRIIAEVSAAAYEDLLRRGWRRFGHEFFRPACPGCVKCRSLRLPVERFQPSRSQRRALKTNQRIRLVVQPPTVSREHVRLYNVYHDDMHRRRGWPPSSISPADYENIFLAGGFAFAREFLYLDDGRLIGVGLADVAPTALSSVYFFYEPGWRSRSPGVFSIMRQWQYARQRGLLHQYLGYWIAECQSMAYKSSYRPHEVLARYPADDEPPIWRPGS